MSTVKKNVIANYLGQGWSALMGLAFLPLYIKYLGIESYGLIGIFALLQAWLTLLDMGMTPTLSREMARFTGGTHEAQSIRDLLRSIEIIGIGIAVVIAVGIWAASGWLASDWLRAEKLPVGVVTQAFTIMGMVTALRFIENIYRSSIVGLQRQVLLNIVLSFMATLRGLGAVGTLEWISPTLEAFFVWQGLVSLITLVPFAAITYSTLPKSVRSGRFSLKALKGVWRFAAGILAGTLTGLLLTSTDKILLSGLLSLEDYGYYSLASVLVGGFSVLLGPINQAFFPRLSELYGRQDLDQLTRYFHKGAQLVSVMVGSLSIIVVFFSKTIIYLWTQDVETVERISNLVSILAFGTLLGCHVWIPYQTQLAYGWPRLSVAINTFSVIFIVPAILVVVPKYGAVGAAWITVCVSGINLLLHTHFMFQKILVPEKWTWLWCDIIKPLLAVAVVAFLYLLIFPSESRGSYLLGFLVLTTISTVFAPVMVASDMRVLFFQYIKKAFSRAYRGNQRMIIL